jgi:DNA invertase Pin-like site-specific DNA recombinase
MATYALCRRSTSKQAFSVDAQREAISTYALNNGLEINDWFIEPPTSGKTAVADRPVLLRALSTLRRGDTLIVLNVSRLARDLSVYCEIDLLIRRSQARLLFADGSPASSNKADPMNKFVADMFALIASLERSMIAERTKRGMKAARRSGKALGRPDRVRYGFSNSNGLLVPNEAEQSIINLAVSLRNEGLSYPAIATRMNASGLRNRVGGLFCKTSVRRMFVQRAKDKSL